MIKPEFRCGKPGFEVTVESFIMNSPRVDVNEYVEVVEVWEASVRATHHFLSEDDIKFLKPLILNEYLSAVELRCVKDAADKIKGFLRVIEGKRKCFSSRLNIEELVSVNYS